MTACEVSEAFVAKRQPQATTPARNFYFEGDRLYSYGRHFVVARWDRDRILYSRRRASVTTSSHTSYLRGAAHKAGVTLIPVWDADRSGADELVWALDERAKTEQEALKRVRRPKDAAKYLDHLTLWDKEWIKQTCEDHSLPLPTLPPWPDELIRLKAACIFLKYPV